MHRFKLSLLVSDFLFCDRVDNVNKLFHFFNIERPALMFFAVFPADNASGNIFDTVFIGKPFVEVAHRSEIQIFRRYAPAIVCHCGFPVLYILPRRSFDIFSVKPRFEYAHIVAINFERPALLVLFFFEPFKPLIDDRPKSFLCGLKFCRLNCRNCQHFNATPFKISAVILPQKNLHVN